MSTRPVSSVLTLPSLQTLRAFVVVPALLALSLAACNTAPAPAPEAGAAGGEPPPAPAPVAPPTHVVYVTNERAGTLTMINAETLEPFGTLEQIGRASCRERV